MDRDEVLDRIIVGRAFTHEHQNDLITAIAAKMVEERFSLLVQRLTRSFLKSLDCRFDHGAFPR